MIGFAPRGPRASGRALTGEFKLADTPVVAEGMLDVGQGHRIYWRSHGNADRPAVVVLHGGPGGAMNLKWGEFFPADQWRLLFFDQRGCGKSTPFGKLEDNTTAALVADIERLRAHLGIASWAVFGGSWGTTLALAYGAAHPQRCLGFLLRGMFLARREDMDWFLWNVRALYPELHERFLDAIETATGTRPVNASEIIALTGAPLARADAAGVTLARAWSAYEAALSRVQSVAGKASPAAAKTAATLDRSATAVEKTAPSPVEDDGRAAVSMALLERHYMAEELPPAPALLDRVAAIAHLPCAIVHGRFDMVCPVDQAWLLSRAWPGADLRIVDGAGHFTFEPGIAQGLHDAVAALSPRLSRD
jgi:proline iminopeptidase